MRLSIANRILIGFAAMLAALVAVGLYGLSQVRDIREEFETIVTRDLIALADFRRIELGQANMREAREMAVTQFLVSAAGRPSTGAPEAMAGWRKHSAETEAAIGSAIAALNDFSARAPSRERAEGFRSLAQKLGQAAAALSQIRVETERQYKAIAVGGVDQVLAVDEPLALARESFQTHMADAYRLLNNVVASGQRRIRQVENDSTRAVLLVLGLAIILGMAAALAIRQSILGPMNAFVTFVNRVGQGDLAGQTAATGNDELGRLGATLNAMVDGLRDLARQTREATENLNASAAEIRASTQQQSASVEEQLAAVQETAATVDEITHSGAQISQRARDVIASAQSTAHTSAAGREAIEEAARAMDAIRDQAEAVAENIVALSERTQAVGDIITTVNDISERSHLLALNAAIEAAAAGESGRSFAVVAAEIKILADQAKDATNQVRSLLGEIQRGINSSVMMTEEAVKRVTVGKTRSEVAQRTIEDMFSRIQESVQTFQQIIASTNQQQIGIEQVMGALQNIRLASQQTVESTRQLDSAASNLAGLSSQLVNLIQRYRI